MSKGDIVDMVEQGAVRAQVWMHFEQEQLTAREFDYQQTLDAWKRALVATRRARLISQDELNFAWNEGCYGAAATTAREMITRMVLSQPATTRRLGVRLPWDAPSVYVCFRPSKAVRSVSAHPANDSVAVAA